jgi:hypothetical protein
MWFERCMERVLKGIPGLPSQMLREHRLLELAEPDAPNAHYAPDLSGRLQTPAELFKR